MKQTNLIRGSALGMAVLTAATFGAVAYNRSATCESRAATDDRNVSLAASRAVSDSSAGLTNAEGQPQLSKAQGPVRVATTGRSVGPPLFEALEVLGRERTLGRLREARARS